MTINQSAASPQIPFLARPKQHCPSHMHSQKNPKSIPFFFHNVSFIALFRDTPSLLQYLCRVVSCTPLQLFITVVTQRFSIDKFWPLASRKIEKKKKVKTLPVYARAKGIEIAECLDLHLFSFVGKNLARRVFIERGLGFIIFVKEAGFKLKGH